MTPYGIGAYPGHSASYNELPSSQPTESSPREQLLELFEWIEDNDRSWADEQADLIRLHNTFLDHGYDLAGIQEIAPAQWQEHSLKIGHRKRFMDTLVAFKKKQR